VAQWGHFGASLKTWYSLWDEDTRFGGQVDLGFLYNFDSFGDSRIGVLAKNLAPSPGMQDRSYTLGLFWPTFWQPLRLVTETTRYESQNAWQLNQGLECLIHTWMGLRCGYQTILQPGDFLPGWTGLGAGLRLQLDWQKWHVFFDYAFLPYDHLGNEHLLTLTLRPSSPPISNAPAQKKRISKSRPLNFQAGREKIPVY
jgi:hypothetical protein